MKTYILPKGSCVRKFFFRTHGVNDVATVIYTDQNYCFSPEQISGSTSFADGILMFTDLVKSPDDVMWIEVDESLSIQIQPSEVIIA